VSVLSEGRVLPRPVPRLAPLALPVLLPVALLLAVLGACDAGPEGDHRSSVEFREEGGVPTLEITGLWGSDWPELSPLRIDTLVAPAGGDDFGLVAPLHAAILADGRIVLGDAGARRVWMASDGGGWEEGPGPGGGPGELGSLGGVWAMDDGFVVHDTRAGDLVRFDAAGRWLDRTRVGLERAVHGPANSRGPWFPTLHPLGGGAWLAAVPEVVSARVEGGAQTVDAEFVWMRGHPAEEEVPLGTGTLRPLVAEGGGGGPVPYAPSAYVAGAAGSVVRFQGSDPTVEALGADGSVARRVRWTDAPEPLTAEHRGTLGAYMRQIAPSEMPPEVLEELIRSWGELMPFPETLPHLGDLRLGEDGTLWLAFPERSGFEMPEEPELVREWRLVPPDAWTGEPRVLRATLPEGVTLLGPAPAAEPAWAPGWTGRVEEGAFFVLLRDDLGRQGIGILRPGSGE
jgi:hypothetical protein